MIKLIKIPLAWLDYKHIVTSFDISLANKINELITELQEIRNIIDKLPK